MSSWEDRFQNHALWAKLTDLESKIRDSELPDGEEPDRESVAYMVGAAQAAKSRREDTEPLFVTQAMLDGVSSSVDQLISYIDYWVSGQYNRSQVDAQTEALLNALGSWPPPNPAQLAEAHIGTIQHVTDTTSQLLAELGAERDSLEQSLTALEQKSVAVDTKLGDQDDVLDAAVSTFKIDSGEATAVAVNAWDTEREKQKAAAEERLDSLANLEKQAKGLVHEATGAVVATDYGKYARNKTVAAWICDVAAALLGAAGVGAVLYHLFTLTAGADGDVGLSLTRFGASVGTLGVAYLVARRGGQHHSEARAAKRTDLALRRVGPFVENLPASVREEITLRITNRVFIRGELDDPKEAEEDDRSLLSFLVKARKAEESTNPGE